MICKLNDLCFIKQALRVCNIGTVVTCINYMGYYLRGDVIEWNGEIYHTYISDNYWIVENSSGIETRYGISKQVYIPDTWLDPIKTDTLDVDDELVAPVVHEYDTI